jgi:uncharacterized protein (DUF2345 family)
MMKIRILGVMVRTSVATGAFVSVHQNKIVLEFNGNQTITAGCKQALSPNQGPAIVAIGSFIARFFRLPTPMARAAYF